MDKQVKIAFSIITIARILQIFLDYNYDWPDEYWQGPEIAYKLANGYGFQTWQWTMQQPLRSIIYQVYLSIGYYIGNYLNFQAINNQRMVKLMQVFLAILCDWFVLKIALFYNSKLTFTTSILILSNWFYFSMLNRTYINSVEASLTVVAFYYWLIRERGKNYDLVSRIIVGLCFIIRTTSIILWAVIWPLELLFLKANRIRFIIKNLIQILAMILVSILFNSYWYNRFTFIEFNFIKYNFILKWSELYGVSSYFYYFYFTIPFIMAGYLLPMMISLVSIFKNGPEKTQKLKKDDDSDHNQASQYQQNRLYKNLFLIVIVSLLILSLSLHKESRFLLILTPFLLILCLKGIQKLQKRSIIIFLIILINLSFLLVFGFYGKTGGVKILRDLREDIDRNHPNNLQSIAVVYLCEPHSLPSYSIVQKNVTFRLLDTSPLRKLQHFNEELELKQHPLLLYTQLTQDLPLNSTIYLIIQDKYSIFNGYLRPQYQFLLKNRYTLLKSERNVNIWEEYQNGYDGFVLLKKS